MIQQLMDLYNELLEKGLFKKINPQTIENLENIIHMIEDGKLVSKEWHDEQVLHDKEEIERLTEKYENMHTEIILLNNEKFELQKQVDELKLGERKYCDLLGRAYKYYTAAKAGGFQFYDEELENIKWECN